MDALSYISTMLELSFNQNSFFANNNIMNFAKNSMDAVKFLFDNESYVKGGMIQSEFIEILLSTRDSEAKQIYIRSLIIFVKNFQLFTTEAAKSLDILEKIVKHPGVHQMFDEELNGIELKHVAATEPNNPIVNEILRKINSILNDSLNKSSDSMTSLNGSFENNGYQSFNEHSNEYQDMVDRVAKHFVKYPTSIAQLLSIVSITNSMPGAKLSLPITAHLLLKELKTRIHYECNEHIYCEKCEKFIKSDFFASSKVRCTESSCNMDILATDSISFIEIELERQIRDILIEYWDTVNEYLHKCKEKSNTNIESAYDGKIVQEIMKKNENVLILTVSTDGASLQKSNAYSIYPLQFKCEFLPPRLQVANIIIAAVFYGKNKPDMLKFFAPTCTEINRLQEVGIEVNGKVFKIFVTCAVFDLPAKASVLQMLQYNGEYACSFCEHPGISINGKIKYPNLTTKLPLRTHSSILRSMEIIKRMKNKKINKKTMKTMGLKGIKGVSPLVAFKNFDLARSNGIDYLHNYLLGVTKSLLLFYTSPKYNKEPYYINKAGRDLLNKRLISLKLCLFISRKPRSLLHLKLFKASEYRTLLLYCLPVCLNGILAPIYIEHLNLLSSALYKLLGKSITESDLADAKSKLNEFIQLYEKYFGESKMTLNAHLLTHISESVKALGPLWSFAMFGFESQNSTLAKYVHGKNNILKEIGLRYMMSKTMKSVENKISAVGNAESDYVLFPRKKIRLSQDDSFVLQNQNISFSDQNGFTIFTRYKKRAEKYTSVEYSRAKKTIDYFVKINDPIVKYGKILYFFVHDNTTFMMIEQFSTIAMETVNHIYQLVPGEKIVLSAQSIEQKMLYMEVDGKCYAVSPPNRIERD